MAGKNIGEWVSDSVLCEKGLCVGEVDGSRRVVAFFLLRPVELACCCVLLANLRGTMRRVSDGVVEATCEQIQAKHDAPGKGKM